MMSATMNTSPATEWDAVDVGRAVSTIVDTKSATASAAEVVSPTTTLTEGDASLAKVSATQDRARWPSGVPRL